MKTWTSRMSPAPIGVEAEVSDALQHSRDASSSTARPSSVVKPSLDSRRR